MNNNDATCRCGALSWRNLTPPNAESSSYFHRTRKKMTTCNNPTCSNHGAVVMLASSPPSRQMAPSSTRRGSSMASTALLAVFLSTVTTNSCQAFLMAPSHTTGRNTNSGAIVSSGRPASYLSALVAAPPPMHVPRLIEGVESGEEFDQVLQAGVQENKVVAVWFQASWCRKCKYIGSRLRHLDEHLPSHLTEQVSLVSLDVNKVAKVPQRENIKDLPTIKFYTQGQEVGSYVAYDRGEVFYSNMERHLRAAIEKL